jgi:hypothetical protein
MSEHCGAGRRRAGGWSAPLKRVILREDCVDGAAGGFCGEGVAAIETGCVAEAGGDRDRP